MPYTFTDASQMVGKRPRQAYWTELHSAVNDLDLRLGNITGDTTNHTGRTDNPHGVTSEQVNIITYKPASDAISSYPIGITTFQVTETSSSGYPSVYGVVQTTYFSTDRNMQYFFDKPVDNTKPGYVYYRKWDYVASVWTSWERVITKSEFDSHAENQDIHFTAIERVKLESIAEGATKVEDSSVNGNIKLTDKNGIISDINVYTHPSGDGYLHVPATGTINSKKVLMAGSTAGSIAWAQVKFSEIKGTITDIQHGYLGGGSLHSLATQSAHGFMGKDDKKKLDGIAPSATNVTDSATNGNILVNGLEQVVYTHPTTHPATMIDEDSSRRFVADSDITRWYDTYTKAEVDSMVSSGTTDALLASNNLSDVANKITSRENLGIKISTTAPSSPVTGDIWVSVT